MIDNNEIKFNFIDCGNLIEIDDDLEVVLWKDERCIRTKRHLIPREKTNDLISSVWELNGLGNWILVRNF